MIETIHSINVLLPILYFLTFSIYLYDFVKDESKVFNVKRVFLFITLSLHILYLLFRTIEFNHPPITNKFEIFTVLAFSLGFAYFLLELLTDIRGTGAFIVLFSLVFQVISSLYIQDLIEVKEVLRNRLLGVHVMSALLGYSGFTIAAVHGVLFFMLYKDIKINRYGLIFKRLPSLEILEKLNFYSVLIGFILLTISILIGFIWLPVAFPDISYVDPKLISVSIVWLVFGIGILTKLIAKWYGKKVIIFSLLGFTVAILSLLASNIFADSFHSFY
ncbi:MAG: cytochrome c biogenesis protein CcsA [Ignavibacteriae bacterium]|nr:cytochrome c biogenesis protein CcsA [Ignavibacteriota bacterium]MCB9209199.1 cytochrome c biogenesis protein CcsA [Ignavibacteriales bacterium]MCB9219551.1 cytochrome c biogenesis protein CcsA [Ignavibacteriales bacterium]MCB9257847.1 cytochrome c biogenesis protein CcsA [Ignavibacteriales bacterium]